jgi:hypothetical protein
MKWCRSSIVFANKVHTSYLEEVQTDRLVSLGSDVQNIQTICVLLVHVSTIIYQRFTVMDFPSVRSIVKSRKLIFTRFGINPISKLVFW